MTKPRKIYDSATSEFVTPRQIEARHGYRGPRIDPVEKARPAAYPEIGRKSGSRKGIHRR